MKRVAVLVSALMLAACAQVPMKQGQQSAGKRYVLNGLVMAPVQSFPQPAYRGLPPIRSAKDLYATREIAARYAKTSRAAVEKGNMELALLSWYAAQQLANQGVSVIGSTLALIQSIGKGGDGTLPARGLAILPAQNTTFSFNDMAVLQEELLRIANTDGVNLADGVQVAGGSDEVLREIMSRPQPNRVQRTDGGVSQGGAAMDELPLNTPVAIKGGLYVERRADVFVIYNNTDAPMTVPLSRIGYIPPLEPPSQARKAAAPYIRQISSSQFSYGNYWIKKRPGFIHCEVQKPNKLACIGTAESVYFDKDGLLASTQGSGAEAYASNPAYRGAMNVIVAAAKIPARENFRMTCGNSPGYYFNERIVGQMAEIKKMYCTPAGGSSEGSITSDLFLGENGAIKTYATLMAEKETRERMMKEAATANAWSDSVSYLPGIGSVEDAARCLGMETSVVKEIYFGFRERNLRMGAALAGWKPSPPDDQSIAATALDCIGAIPLATTAAKGIKAGAGFLKNNKAFAASASHAGELFDTFRKSMAATDAGKAYQELGATLQRNPQVVQFVKGTFDLIQQGNDMAATVSGASYLVEQL